MTTASGMIFILNTEVTGQSVGQFAVSRIGVRSQTVIPKAVRDTLSIRPGDQIGFVIANGKVELVKVVPAQDNPFGCFEEWDSDADTKGYRSF